MGLEHAAVGGRRPVERDLLPHTPVGLGHLVLVDAGHDEDGQRDLEVGTRPTGLVEPPLERGQRGLAQVGLGGEAVREQPVAHLTRHLGHARADGGEEDLGRAVAGSGRG